MISVNIAFIGHLNNPAMVAGMGLSCLYITLVCYSIFVGFNYLIGTLSSQAYGKGDLHLVGVFLNKGRIVAVIIFIPQLVLMLFTEIVLLKLGMDPEACKYAGIFTNTAIPGFFFLS